jgi:YidC/Oxa1 family membrane protein insertase
MMQWRLVVAFLAMGAVLFLSPYFYKHFAPPPPAPAAQQKPAAKPAQPATSAAAEPAAAPAAAPERAPGRRAARKLATAVRAVAASREETVVIDTSLYRVVLSNRGATVRSWVLKKYMDGAGQPLDLVAPGARQSAYPFALAFRKEKPAADLNNALFVAQAASDGLGVDFEYSDANVAARKSFRFDRNSYLSQFSSEVTQGAAGLPHLIQWRGGFGDMALRDAASQQRTVSYDLASGKLNTRNVGAAKDGPVTDTGAYSFAGVEDSYFAAVFLPQADGLVVLRTLSDNVTGAAGTGAQPHVGAAVGGGARNRFSVFVGPKDLDLLKRIDPRLEQMVDFGWFWFIAKPLFLVLNWLNDKLAHNYGWAIVLLTILINFAILPMRLKSMKSMKRMQSLQPQIAAINAKYKNVGLRDPRKAQQNEEVMGLYKKHGVNPMGGCLPMLLQIPVFFGFYKVLTVAIEMRGAHWLWVTDLSQPEHLPIRILPVAMIVAQFVMQKMTPNPSVDQNQQRMMLMLPLVFGFMFYGVASGLVLYWLTSNLVGIAQQWFINRSMGAAGAGAAAPVVAAKPKKGGGRR